MLTTSQDKALLLAKDWIDSQGQLLKIGGPAGSGKSFIIPLIADLVGIDNCLLMTPTGKAANNLQKAGLQAHTIHSTIYKVKRHDDAEEIEVDEDEVPLVDYEETEPEFVLRDPADFENKRLFIIDEGSMVGGRLLKDILSLGVPTLLVGDPNQLAPVNDTSVYLRCDFYLEEIVRQAKDSPIIWLSQRALDGHIAPGTYGSCMVRQGTPSDSELMYADVVLSDTNARRSQLNQHIRDLTFGKTLKNWLAKGDKVICRTNDPSYYSSEGFALTNGTQGEIVELKHLTPIKASFKMHNYDLGVYNLEGTNRPLKFHPKKRPPTIELGYALTVHLSQGSEWNNVIYDLSKYPMKRAMYTAITRAKESLLVTL